MFEKFWEKHYHPGLTPSFHGDMAAAFAAILDDPDSRFYMDSVVNPLLRSVRIHMQIERSPRYAGGRKWFCEKFGTALEQAGG